MLIYIKCHPRNLLRISSFIFLASCSIQNTAAEYFSDCHNGVAYDAHWFEYLARRPANTKYLFYYGHVNKSIDWCQQYCWKSGLALATITSLSDYQSISKMMTLNGVCWKRGTLIDGNDASEEGKWVYNKAPAQRSVYKEPTPLKFMAFNFFDPVNSGYETNTPANLLWLKCKEKIKNLHGSPRGAVFLDLSNVSGLVGQACICEFTQNTKCWKDSDETKKNEAKLSTIEKLEQLGETEERKYFSGQYQKTWKEALKTCKSNNMKLLDLEFANAEEAQLAAKYMQRFVSENDLMAQVTSFWLSGSFSKLFTDEEVPFEFDWIDEEWRKKGSPHNFFPGKVGQITHGNCMSVGAIYWDSNTLTLAPAVCTVPRWFICYRDA